MYLTMLFLVNTNDVRISEKYNKRSKHDIVIVIFLQDNMEWHIFVTYNVNKECYSFLFRNFSHLLRDYCMIEINDDDDIQEGAWTSTTGRVFYGSVLDSIVFVFLCFFLKIPSLNFPSFFSLSSFDFSLSFFSLDLDFEEDAIWSGIGSTVLEVENWVIDLASISSSSLSCCRW